MHPTTWNFDIPRSRVEFRVRHMMVSTVVGRFPRWRGTLDHDPARPTSTTVEVFVDVASVETGDAGRDEYLRTSELFDVGRYPEMHFRSRGVTARGEGWLLEGDLSIRGATRNLRLEVTRSRSTLEDGHERVVFEARGSVRRKDFGLTWSRFVEAGGLTVGDEVEIVLHVEATRTRLDT